LGLENNLAPGEGVAFLPELGGQILQAYEASRVENWDKTRRIVEEFV
jgi:hypothetical protein